MEHLATIQEIKAALSELSDLADLAFDEGDFADVARYLARARELQGIEPPPTLH